MAFWFCKHSFFIISLRKLSQSLVQFFPSVRRAANISRCQCWCKVNSIVNNSSKVSFSLHIIYVKLCPIPYSPSNPFQEPSIVNSHSYTSNYWWSWILISGFYTVSGSALLTISYSSSAEYWVSNSLNWSHFRKWLSVLMIFTFH